MYSGTQRTAVSSCEEALAVSPRVRYTLARSILLSGRFGLILRARCNSFPAYTMVAWIPIVIGGEHRKTGGIHVRPVIAGISCDGPIAFDHSTLQRKIELQCKQLIVLRRRKQPTVVTQKSIVQRERMKRLRGRGVHYILKCIQPLNERRIPGCRSEPPRGHERDNTLQICGNESHRSDSQSENPGSGVPSFSRFWFHENNSIRPQTRYERNARMQTQMNTELRSKNQNDR